MNQEPDVARIELDLLLEAIYQRWGYDFRSYSRACIERRTALFLSSAGGGSVAELIPRVLHDAELFSRIARQFSIGVTELFRDPWVYRALRQEVVPVLRTWPHFKVWHAGCATGEEVHSLAIVLMEEGLYDQATIYATDFNDEALERARAGIYETAKLQEASRGYQKAGGKGSLSDYYEIRRGAAVMDAALRKRAVFAGHNLATDAAFGEMHLILCRNVLIYFNRDLRERVLGLFVESLVNGGFLCLGTEEDAGFTKAGERFEVVDARARIYRLRGATRAAGAASEHMAPHGPAPGASRTKADHGASGRGDEDATRDS